MKTDDNLGDAEDPDSGICRPLISVVVPVFNVERYLDECLGSVLDQSYADIELIAADGASTDESPEILRTWARKDCRLKVLSVGKRGAGRARNAGLSESRGDYVWFVDGDDVVIEGAMSAIADTITELGPDVLLIGHEELLPDGSIRCRPEDHLLRSSSRSFTLAENPRVVNLTMTSWSKVVRRTFLVSLAIPFPEGRHEDVPVFSAALLSAKKISTLDRVCYRYRKHRPGALMAKPTEANVAIFDSYHFVFALISAGLANRDGRVTDQVATAFFERAIQHYASILSTGGRGSDSGSPRLIPDYYRPRFFQLMHNDYVSYRPPHYRRPKGARWLAYFLIEHNAFRVYTLLEPLNNWRVALLKKLTGKTRGGGSWTVISRPAASP
jgi:CDP-glycerol glycerophosphotransferase